jgi:glycosyltransferase involved in cell wall biosynthesis
MSSNTPLFSIVIPTRNRAHLLKGALQSALTQDFNDYEIVVVANNCDDNTREVVAQVKDERVRYFETTRTLPMPQNWEYAWTKATGQYVTYLPDDDALVPTALSSLANNALNGTPPVISWEDAVYYYPDWNDKRVRNVLLLFFFGNDLIENIPSEVYREQIAHFDFAWSAPIPKMLNCAVNREFFESWRDKLNLLFFPAAPDYSFAWISTQVCPEIRVFHRPLTVRGISDYSIGSNAGMGAATQEFYREFGEFDFFADTIVNIPTSLNLLAATFMRVNAAFRQIGMQPQSLDWERFLLSATKQFKDVQSYLPNWSDYIPHLLSASQKISPQLHQQVQTILAAPVPVVQGEETLADLRRRTARMALEYPPNLVNATKNHAGDEQCGRCVLGMEDSVLVDADWSYLYIFGDEIDAKSPYDMSLVTDRYYDLLTRCRGKQKKV